LLGLEERIEDASQRPCLNSDACIAKLEDQIGFIVAARSYRDSPAGWGEFDRVLDQIPENLLEPGRITVDEVSRGCDVYRELEPLASISARQISIACVRQR